jgi:hypothetical protein
MPIPHIGPGSTSVLAGALDILPPHLSDPIPLLLPSLHDGDGTLKMAHCHMYHVIANIICRRHSLAAGKICAVCRVLLTGKGVRIVCVEKAQSLIYASRAWVQTDVAILDQLAFPDCAMVFVILKPNTFISALYGMSKTPSW